MAVAAPPAAAQSGIDRILEGVPLPAVVPVRQEFPDSPIADLEAALEAALAAGGLAEMVRPGQRVALAVGSRGLANLPELVRLLVQALRRLQADPFVVPAMGSHGGATAAGQTQLLAKMGVTEDAVGAPIRSSMEVVALGEAAPGLTAYSDRLAAAADATLILGRVKPHSSFRGRYESGLIKMLAIGLGKQKGAESCHTRGFGQLAERIAAVGRSVLARGNVVGGLAVVENARHQTHHLELVPATAIPEREPALLELAWQLYPKLPFDELDVLVIGRIGKDISGTGLDCNVVGRYTTPFASGGPAITRLVALDTTPLTGGNVNGIGVVDVTTQRVFDKLSFAETYPNALTSTATTAVKIPMVMADDRRAIQAAIRTSTIPDPAAVRLAWIRDTLSLDQLQVSANMAADVAARPEASGHRPAAAAALSPPTAAWSCKGRGSAELLGGGPGRLPVRRPGKQHPVHTYLIVQHPSIRIYFLHEFRCKICVSTVDAVDRHTDQGATRRAPSVAGRPCPPARLQGSADRLGHRDRHPEGDGGGTGARGRGAGRLPGVLHRSFLAGRRRSFLLAAYRRRDPAACDLRASRGPLARRFPDPGTGGRTQHTAHTPGTWAHAEVRIRGRHTGR